MDDFRIYNRALTASEVTHVMNGQATLPAAELPFNETTGTTANDVSGNSWNGTLTGGASWAAGIKGNAVNLDGTNGYVAQPAGVVSADSAITITAWVYLDTVSNWVRIFDFGSGTSNYMFLSPQNGANSENPLFDQKKRFVNRKRHRRDRGAANGWLASCGRNLGRLYRNDLRRWPEGGQQYRNVSQYQYG